MKDFTPAELADICDRAADEIMVRGGTVYTLKDNEGRVCINGALLHALGLEDRLKRRRGSPIGKSAWAYIPTHDEDYATFVGPPEIQKAISQQVDGKATFVWSDGLGISPEADNARIEVLRQVAKDFREQT